MQIESIENRKEKEEEKAPYEKRAKE